MNTADVFPPPMDAQPVLPKEPQSKYDEEPLVDESVLVLSEQQARDALEKWVSTTWMRRRNGAFPVISIVPSNSYHLMLETFVETRCQRIDTRPDTGGPVDDETNGEPPSPWEISAQPPSLFCNSTTNMVLPHTEMVRICHLCRGSGRVHCQRCLSSGSLICRTCGGKAQTLCKKCNGDGRNCQACTNGKILCGNCQNGKSTCNGCHGSGRMICNTCEGLCKLVHFTRLDISWSNRISDCVIEGADLSHVFPEAQSKGVGGPLLWMEQQQKLNDSHSKGPRLNQFVEKNAQALISKSKDPNVLLHQ